MVIGETVNTKGSQRDDEMESDEDLKALDKEMEEGDGIVHNPLIENIKADTKDDPAILAAMILKEK